MKAQPSNFPDYSEIDQAAAAWVLRMDRGLSPSEQDEYSQWLAADSRHRDAIAFHRWSWDEFDRLAGLQTTQHARVNPDLLAPENHFGPSHFQRILRQWKYLVPVAAAIAVIGYAFMPNAAAPVSSPAEDPSFALVARIQSLDLNDGSSVEINRGAIVTPAYTAHERRVKLIKGEANFKVAKDPNRPFIVEVAGVSVKAIGTVFNVRYSEDLVDVIVSEGRVQVNSSSDPESAVEDRNESMLTTGERALLSLDEENPDIEVIVLDREELEEELRWQPRLLDFDAVPLSDIVVEFNASNPVKLVIDDPELEEISLSSTFRSDNVEGFVRLLESGFGMKAEWRGQTEIALTSAR
ncbi:MAG: FecR domain-containing protein [Verrucomicrobiota bacterium]